MNRISVASFVVVAFLSTSCLGGEPAASAGGLAHDAATLFAAGNVPELIQLFHIPPSYTPQQKEEEISGLSSGLGHLLSRFGPASEVVAVRGAVVFYNVGAGSGDQRYWQSLPGAKFQTHVFTARFENIGPGVLKIVTATTEPGAAPELRSFDVGLLAVRADAKAVVAETYVGLMEAMGSSIPESLKSRLQELLQPSEYQP
jgi:hypothetical protein